MASKPKEKEKGCKREIPASIPILFSSGTLSFSKSTELGTLTSGYVSIEFWLSQGIKEPRKCINSCAVILCTAKIIYMARTPHIT